ncbi:uracil-DNA glycosylase [Ammoniphilus sp. YIM 78166]|uniref:uracil-DNA glycosylase n=1 Tax=Ammoniphilus sp. YIM 78166 TaxID=1644106 RepID=UPI0010703046|nr:uracil-DNA glycosylase [Ammoniphilus sp. YIM 78166]
MEKFRPLLLPEESAPAYAVDCQRCELSKQRKRVIWGEGNPQAELFIVMDNPGARETKEGDPFVCGTRETLQRGLLEAELDIHSVYISYLLKCRPIRAYNKPMAREACLSHLHSQLKEKTPALLLGLGNIVVQSFYTEKEDVKSLRGSWHTWQNYPIAFSYHPLAVRRRPVLMKYFVEDLKLVEARLKNHFSKQIDH